MENQIRELTNQMATLQDMLLNRVHSNHGRPNQGWNTVRIMFRHHHLQRQPQDGVDVVVVVVVVVLLVGTPHDGGGSDSSDSNEDPYRREKRLMRVKHFESMKLSAIPHHAAKCRSFRIRIQLYRLVCKMAKGDETPVFNWISECNTAEEEATPRTNDFPALDRILGAKLLELAAPNPKFALELQTWE